MFVIFGATGNTGKIVADLLLNYGQRVRVVVRDPAKGAPWREKGADVVIGSLDDEASVRAALAGSNGVYLLMPPQPGDEDPLGTHRKMADVVARAARAAEVKHLVLLSSIGAQHAEGTGPIRSLHYAEETLKGAVQNFTSLRAGYFIENWAGMLARTRETGVLPSFVTPGTAVPMIATRDIGRAAVEELMDPRPGLRVVELVSIKPWTPEEVAADVGRILGRDVRVEGLPLDAVVPAFTSFGFSNNAALLIREMIHAINSGRVALEGGRAVLRLGTLRPREVLEPLLQSQDGRQS
jgi:uncharacterized protein YbjT (DUF2867 family)